MEHKHIDPEPDCRYIIFNVEENDIDSAVVIESTDRYVRLQWDRTGEKRWYPWSYFEPLTRVDNKPGSGYHNLQIIEQLETPR